MANGSRLGRETFLRVGGGTRTPLRNARILLPERLAVKRNPAADYLRLLLRPSGKGVLCSERIKGFFCLKIPLMTQAEVRTFCNQSIATCGR